MKVIKLLSLACMAIAALMECALASASALVYPDTTDADNEDTCWVDSARRGAVFTRELRAQLEVSSFESRSSENTNQEKTTQKARKYTSQERGLVGAQLVRFGKQLVQKGTDRRAAIAEQPIAHNFISTRQFSLV